MLSIYLTAIIQVHKLRIKGSLKLPNACHVTNTTTTRLSANMKKKTCSECYKTVHICRECKKITGNFTQCYGQHRTFSNTSPSSSEAIRKKKEDAEKIIKFYTRALEKIILIRLLGLF